MRLYGGKLLKQKTQKQLRQAQELRDAIVFDVTPADRYCRVKIQGSAEYIKAYYPENWEQTPSFLKPGNAVRITHPGGNRGRIEIAGNGILRPTDVNSQKISVTPETLTDTVLTGCGLSPSKPESMSIKVAYGTYRIDGITYTLTGMLMDNAGIEMDRLDLLMDEVSDSATFDAAHSSFFRYDSVCIGIDGVIDVVKGTSFATGGTIPAPPSALPDHLRLGWVLIPPNTTEITGGLINKYYTAPVAAYLTNTIADNELEWGKNTTTITIYARDQYGNLINGNYYITMTWTRGNGTLSRSGDSATSPTAFTFNFTGTYAEVTYTREGEPTPPDEYDEESPIITIADADPTISNTVAYILLYDITGALV